MLNYAFVWHSDRKKVISDLQAGRYTYGPAKAAETRTPARPYSSLSWHHRDLERLSVCTEPYTSLSSDRLDRVSNPEQLVHIQSVFKFAFPNDQRCIVFHPWSWIYTALMSVVPLEQLFHLPAMKLHGLHLTTKFKTFNTISETISMFLYFRICEHIFLLKVCWDLLRLQVCFLYTDFHNFRYLAQS